MLCQGYAQFSTDRDFYEDVPKSDFATFYFAKSATSRWNEMIFSTYAYNNDRPENLIRRNFIHIKREITPFVVWAFCQI